MFTEKAHDKYAMISIIKQIKMIGRRPNLSGKKAKQPARI